MFPTNLNSTKLGRILACALIASALSAPAASAEVDLRSADARDAATPQVDVRMPDTRDAANSPTYVDDPQNVTADATASGGFDWSTAGISVAALSGLLIVSIAVFSGVRHGKRWFARS
jgi:uncharacterized protein YcnI